MSEDAVLKYITNTFANVEVLAADGDSYIYYQPDRAAPDHRFPFATLVTGDRHDQVSDLDRPGVYRLNVGVKKQTFAALFGPDALAEGAHDFAALDRLMPHPVYGKMYWVCVLCPGETTFAAVRLLLAEAYEMAVARHARRPAAEENAT